MQKNFIDHTCSKGTELCKFLCCFARSHNSFNIDPETSRTSHRLIFCFCPSPVTRWQEEESCQRGGFSIWSRDASVAGVLCVLCTQGGLNTPTAWPAVPHMSALRPCNTHTPREEERRIIKSMVAPALIISIVCHNHQMSHSHTCYTMFTRSVLNGNQKPAFELSRLGFNFWGLWTQVWT